MTGVAEAGGRMMSGMSITDFLLARITEDEAGAQAATPGPWRWEEPAQDDFPESDKSLVSDGRMATDMFGKPLNAPAYVLSGRGYDASGINADDSDRAHIAKWNPVRVLAECKVKRALVESCDSGYMGNQIIRILAAVYADHPDYRQDTDAQGGRDPAGA